MDIKPIVHSTPTRMNEKQPVEIYQAVLFNCLIDVKHSHPNISFVSKIHCIQRIKEFFGTHLRLKLVYKVFKRKIIN